MRPSFVFAVETTVAALPAASVFGGLSKKTIAASVASATAADEAPNRCFLPIVCPPYLVGYCSRLDLGLAKSAGHRCHRESAIPATRKRGFPAGWHPVRR